MLGELFTKLLIFIVIFSMFMVPAYSGWFDQESQLNQDMMISFINLRAGLDTTINKTAQSTFVDENHFIEGFPLNSENRPKKCKPQHPAKKANGCICVCDLMKSCKFERMTQCRDLAVDLKESFTISPVLLNNQPISQVCEIVKEDNLVYVRDCKTI